MTEAEYQAALNDVADLTIHNARQDAIDAAIVKLFDSGKSPAQVTFDLGGAMNAAINREYRNYVHERIRNLQ